MKLRILLFLIPAILTTYLINGQSLKGQYQYEDALMHIDFSFRDEHTFEQLTSGGGGHHVDKFVGYYKLISDTLILFFQNQVDKNASSYELLDKKIEDKNKLVSQILVKNENAKPMPGVFVFFKTKEGATILTLFTDKDGKIGEVYVDANSIVDHIELMFLGYKTLRVNMVDIKPGSYNITATLKPSDYVELENSERTVKLLYKIGKDRSLIVRGVGETDPVVYKKIDK